MKIYQSSQEAKGKIKKAVVALGNFDGVHLAHQKLFDVTQKLARSLKGKACVYTFFPHPVKVLSPLSAPLLITTLQQKIKILEKSKIAFLILEPFISDFAHLSPEEFFEKILLQKLNIAGIVVGYDFTFGAKRGGNAELLFKLCKQRNIPCKIVEAQHKQNTLISSSQIRHFVRSGEVAQAQELLGRPFELSGEVVKGEGVGKSLGFPTANILVENELIPGNGVYATYAKIGLRNYPSLTNIGFRPTFGGKRLSIETHLLKFKKNIYGKKIRIQFLKKMRDEVHFSSVPELITQIQQDVAAAHKIFRRKK